PLCGGALQGHHQCSAFAFRMYLPMLRSRSVPRNGLLFAQVLARRILLAPREEGDHKISCDVRAFKNCISVLCL
ncbi:hypothetical protein CEXT_587511, partial [Caerostris extrusa]